MFAGIAQLVERNLAKVEVDGSNPFSRSSFKELQQCCMFDSDLGAIAKRLCPGLQIRLDQFDSGSRLQKFIADTVFKRPFGAFFFSASRIVSILGAVPLLRPRLG